jgi:hypothetical protein
MVALELIFNVTVLELYNSVRFCGQLVYVVINKHSMLLCVLPKNIILIFTAILNFQNWEHDFISYIESSLLPDQLWAAKIHTGF